MAISPTMRKADYNQGHAASLPISVNLPLTAPEPFQDPRGFDRAIAVNPVEVEHLKEHGFIVKRGLIEDPAVFEKVEDYIWRNVPRGLMQREDPESWIDFPNDEWTEADSLQVCYSKEIGRCDLRTVSALSRFLLTASSTIPTCVALRKC